MTGQQGGERGSAVGTRGSGSQAGLAGAYPEGGCVCLGGVCGGCPLGWDGRTHCNFHLICCCPLL